MSVALNRLRSGDDGHPLLNVLFCGVRFLAKKVEVFVSRLFVAFEAEQKVRSRRVGGTVTLRRVRPVDDIRLTGGSDDDIARVEVAVAKFFMLGHTFETGVEFVGVVASSVV